jgi:hypothetical protein
MEELTNTDRDHFIDTIREHPLRYFHQPMLDDRCCSSVGADSGLSKMAALWDWPTASLVLHWFGWMCRRATEVAL